MKRSDFTIIVGVIGIVILMVMPVSPVILDVLLIINLSVSLMILLVAMNTREPLQFAVFPSLLLLTTLFRLSLNVSSTRLILSTGDAGNVIHTFGDFVIGGNAVVGFIVFSILVVIQFIVITKGAERVAEVAARFTLDAMPGKQISIDADLNAGLITEAQARERRRNIEREADFYGAMDGASKFVKGDAIAAIIIVIINVLGGFIIGMAQRHLDLQTALQQYTLLSVGDGLVSQLPALLISTATGIVVTRAASDGNLGSDVMKQILAYPRMLYVVAGVLVLLGLFTPIGLPRTVPVAVALAFGAYRMLQASNQEAKEQLVRTEEKEEAQTRQPESVLSLISVDPVEFEFGYALIALADARQGGDLLDRVVMIRRQIALELGVVIPVIRIRDHIQLQPNEYVIKIKGNEVARGEMMLDHYLAMSSGVDDPHIVGVPTKEPAFGLPALWIASNMRDRAQLAGYTVVDPPSVVATHLTEVLKRHAHELLGRQETKVLVDTVKDSHPALTDELIPSLLSVGEVQKVLVNLLRERVSIRDLVTIFETLADTSRLTKDTDLLTEYVRQSLSRQITHQYRAGQSILSVLTLQPTLEKLISDHLEQNEHGSYLALDPRVTQQIYRALSEQANRLSAAGNVPIVVTAPSVRPHLRKLIERVLPDVAVLSYNELDTSVEVQSGGVVAI